MILESCSARQSSVFRSTNIYQERNGSSNSHLSSQVHSTLWGAPISGAWVHALCPALFFAYITLGGAAADTQNERCQFTFKTPAASSRIIDIPESATPRAPAGLSAPSDQRRHITVVRKKTTKPVPSQCEKEAILTLSGLTGNSGK
jgi:hypothetical protein